VPEKVVDKSVWHQNVVRNMSYLHFNKTKIKEMKMSKGQKKIVASMSFVLITLMFLQTVCFSKEKITLTYWNHEEQYDTYYNPWIEEIGRKGFARLHPEVKGVNVVTVPYSGYEAKYLSVFLARKGAPDAFQNRIYNWYEYCEPFPDEMLSTLKKHVLPGILRGGMWEGKLIAIPTAYPPSSFQMLYINADMFKEAGLNPDTPIETLDELLECAKKLTKYDSADKITRVGFALRYSGHKGGIFDKFAPFLHTFGAIAMSPDQTTASGYINSPEAIESLKWYSNLVNKYRVSSLEIGTPVTAFGNKTAAMMFREGWVVGWLRDSAPDINYRVYPLPFKKVKVGAGTVYAETDSVYKYSPHKKLAQEFMFYVWEHSLEGFIRQELVPPVWKEDLDCSYMRIHPIYKATKEMLINRPFSPVYTYFHPNLRKIIGGIGDEILNALYQKKSPKQAFDDAARIVNGLLKE